MSGSRLFVAVACGLALSVAHARSGPRTWVVCPADSSLRGCDFKGDRGLSQAVDEAASGDTVRIRAGHYVPVVYRDSPFQKVVIRAYLTVESKDIALAGESGVVLDGATGEPASALAVINAGVSVHDLEIANFRYAVEEDDIYDGHGIFAIDGRVRIDNVTIRNTAKMALTGRNNTTIEAKRLSLLDGHVAVWLHENASATLSDCTLRANSLSGIAAYDDSVAHVSACTIEGSGHDALFTQHRAVIYAKDTNIVASKRFAVQASGDSRIWVDSGSLTSNQADMSTRDHGEIRIAAAVHRDGPPAAPN
jgi:hypothetical protein